LCHSCATLRFRISGVPFFCDLPVCGFERVRVNPQGRRGVRMAVPGRHRHDVGASAMEIVAMCALSRECHVGQIIFLSEIYPVVRTLLGTWAPVITGSTRIRPQILIRSFNCSRSIRTWVL
jgi:hypothetical protein